MNWNKETGLIPAIVQDEKTSRVLMLGYMNEESLAKTRDTGKVTFYSRSRKSLWVKGETSGNFFNVVSIKPDCDDDTLLISVHAEGPACHRLTETCFDPSGFAFLSKLEGIVQDRFEHPIDSSYTSKLILEGLDRVVQKVGEEGIETVIAAKNDDLLALEGEAADLLFHLAVLLRFKNTSLQNVVRLLEKRHQK